MFKNNIATIAVIFGFAMIIKKITMLENKIKVITEMPLKVEEGNVVVKDVVTEELPIEVFEELPIEVFEELPIEVFEELPIEVFEELPIELEEIIYESVNEDDEDDEDDEDNETDEDKEDKEDNEEKVFEELCLEEKKGLIAQPSPSPPPQENDSHYEHVTTNTIPFQQFEQPPLTRSNSASFWAWNIFN
jgi:hypothetical protein